MRTKILSGFLLLASLLFLFGCASKTKVKSPLSERSGNYSSTASISYKELKAVASISQETPSSCSVVFESPPSLSGMGFIFKKDSVDLNYKGLSFSFEPDSLPGGMAANIAVSAINKAMRDDGLSIELNDGAIAVKGVMQIGEFSLRLDKETGNLIKLSVPSEELEIEFYNFKFLD